MTRRAVEFWEAWLLIALVLVSMTVWVLRVPPSPVSSPGGGGVPAVTGTAGTSTTQ